VRTCVLRTDSKVVSGQIEKECIAREPTLERYLALARNTAMPTDVFFQVLEDASIKTVLSEPRVINIIEGEDWRAPIMGYLRHYCKPDNKK
jgi:hypothetical protein